MNLDTQNAIQLTVPETSQMHAAILGMTGSGKTNTLHVLAEEMSAEGSKVTIVDPEGDYGSLRFGTKAIILGRGRKGNHIDIELSLDNAAAAADVMCRYDTPIVILDISGFDIDEQDEFVNVYVGRLWKNYKEEDFPVHRLIIDEVQLFAPQGEKTASKKLLQDMMRRARKRDFTLAIATQEPQTVDKRLLNATRIRLFHKVAKGTAFNAIKTLLPGTMKNPDDVISGLGVGDCIFMVDNAAKRVKIRTSSTFLPSNGSYAVAVQLPLDGNALDKLKGLISANKVADDVKTEVQQATQDTSRIAQLEEENGRLRSENLELRRMLAEKASTPVDVPPIDPDIEERDHERLRLAQERECERQRKAYQQLLFNIKHYTHLDRQIISFLVDHEPSEFDVKDIGAAVALSPSTAFSMTSLYKSELVSRRKVGRGFIYRSRVLERVDRYYPLIGRATAMQEIARLAAQR